MDAAVEAPGSEVAVADVAQPKAMEKERVRGMQTLRSWLSDPDDAKPAQPPSSKTLRFAIEVQVRSYMSSPAPPGSKDAIKWWRDVGRSEYWAVAPGARALLKLSTGNASLERIFSKAIRVYGDKLRKSADVRRAMLLVCNAYALGIEGYGTDDADSDDEDGVPVITKAVFA